MCFEFVHKIKPNKIKLKQDVNEHYLNEVNDHKEVLRYTQISLCLSFFSHSTSISGLSPLNLFISSDSAHGCLTHWFGCVIDGKICPIIPLSPTFPLQYQYQNFCLLNYSFYQSANALISSGSFHHSYPSFCLCKIFQCSSVSYLSRLSGMSLEIWFVTVLCWLCYLVLFCQHILTLNLSRWCFLEHRVPLYCHFSTCRVHHTQTMGKGILLSKWN